ncbi:MAG: hypothetical protein GX575_13195 [Candidatus Anammoximicrobium sp.]|nr:hypothetical protein [Candidatus Anammoximicrobium sp.]
MTRSGLTALVVWAGLAGWLKTGAEAQQVQLTSPFQSINESFYENFGFGGLNLGRSGPGGGWYFRSGPANSAPPPFGGYDPSASARFGMQFGGPWGPGFNMLAGQGSNRTHTMTAPTIVVPHGGSGYLFSGSMVPFVTGVVPVVGNAPLGMMPMMPQTQSSLSPLAERAAQLRQQAAAPAADLNPAPPPVAREEPPLVLKGGQAADAPTAARPPVTGSAADSSANRGDISVAEIRRQQAQQEAARQEEIQVRIEKARGHEEAGNPGLAKIYYQQAAARADGELKQQLLAKIRSLGETQ